MPVPLLFLLGLGVLFFAPDGPGYAALGVVLCALGIPGLLKVHRARQENVRRRGEALERAQKDLEDLERRLDADLAKEKEEPET